MRRPSKWPGSRSTAWRAGGIYDHLGGGFHRYSTDAAGWCRISKRCSTTTPCSSRCYLDAFQVTGDAFFRDVAEETLDYSSREMTSPEGGFYSTLDADSEGDEGKFYVWSAAEIDQLLGDDSAFVPFRLRR